MTQQRTFGVAMAARCKQLPPDYFSAMDHFQVCSCTLVGQRLSNRPHHQQQTRRSEEPRDEKVALSQIPDYRVDLWA